MQDKYAPQLVQKLQLSFPVLSDPGNRVAEQFGVVYTLSNGMKEIYKDLGIDLERFNGDTNLRLPMPGRIIIDGGGIIRDVDIHPDHTTRPEPEETLAILRSLK